MTLNSYGLRRPYRAVVSLSSARPTERVATRATAKPFKPVLFSS